MCHKLKEHFLSPDFSSISVSYHWASANFVNLRCGFEVITVCPSSKARHTQCSLVSFVHWGSNCHSPARTLVSLPWALIHPFFEIRIYLPGCVWEVRKRVSILNLQEPHQDTVHALVSTSQTNSFTTEYFYSFIAVICLKSGWHQSHPEHFLKIQMPKAPPQFYQIRNYQVEVQGSEFILGVSSLCVRDLGQANLLEASIRDSCWGWEVGLEDLEGASQITVLSGWFLVGRSQLPAEQ